MYAHGPVVCIYGIPGIQQRPVVQLLQRERRVKLTHDRYLKVEVWRAYQLPGTLVPWYVVKLDCYVYQSTGRIKT